MPKLSGVLETALYVDDLDRAAAFYRDIFDLPVLFWDDRLCALAVAGKQVLLLFVKGASAEAAQLPGGTIPGHDGAGRLHLAFAIESDDLVSWEAALASREIAIEGRMSWPRGGTSLYFRDPDGHLLELATPGLWTIR
jgi:catechol 2,3-dioxygenase-like lactoylglutathione lyase family enzyme